MNETEKQENYSMDDRGEIIIHQTIDGLPKIDRCKHAERNGVAVTGTDG